MKELEEMKTVILAGGRGTRMQEVTHEIPKPMLNIGSRPIIWHIMKIYNTYGLRYFDIALGYKGHIIKDYFKNYVYYMNSLEVDLGRKCITELNHTHEDWIVRLIDTGIDTQTGGRLARMKDYIGNHRFFFTYGDGVADINIAELLKFHISHGKLVTVTAVRPPSRFGAISFDKDGHVSQFSEKPSTGDFWISGGFFVMEPEVFDYVSWDESCILEREALTRITQEGELLAYQHKGFWQCMDTVRDNELLNELWQQEKAPWCTWNVADHSHV